MDLIQVETVTDYMEYSTDRVVKEVVHHEAQDKRL